MDTQKLAETFVKLADTLVDDFDVVDLLYTLTSQCVDLMGSGGAGLLLVDERGDLRITVASTERARHLELLQIQSDEGPCLECFHTGQPVSADDLASARDRWPRFTAAATAEGYTSVLALPLRLRGQVIGALNLFGNTDSSPIPERDVPVAQALADVATIAILQDRLARSRGLLAEQLQVALNSRVTIEQAKGALASRLGVDTAEAFEILRAHARSNRLKLTDVAAGVVHGNLPSGWPQRARRSEHRR